MVSVRLLVTGQVKNGTLVRVLGPKSGMGPWALPAETEAEFVSGPKHVRQGAQGEVDPLGGGRR